MFNNTGQVPLAYSNFSSVMLGNYQYNSLKFKIDYIKDEKKAMSLWAYAIFIYLHVVMLNKTAIKLGYDR